MSASVATAAAAAPASSPALLTSALSHEEKALARFLRDDVISVLERARGGDERRVEAYLALNTMLRLEDTEGSVRVLQHLLPVLLREIHDDLQHATVQDVVDVALRSLSYFMHHKSLAPSFADAQVEAILSDIVSRLATTQEERTYKSCLWCLTMQRFDLTRLDFLHRIVEALVLAIVNPFNSRAIAVEALKGLHLMLFRFKPQMAARTDTLFVWFRPVASRLSSSDKATRQSAALVLLEVAAFSLTHAWSSDVENEISAALVEYALPAMQAHMTHERCYDALIVWKLVVILMRRKFALDPGLVNDLLAAPEQLMQHEEAQVRLQSMEAWHDVIHVFRDSNEWIFKRPALVVLMRPIVLCLERERAFNVLHAAVATWRVVVAAIVNDFNAYCSEQGPTVDAIQQNAKKWKRWVDEVIKKVLVVAIEQEKRQPDGVLRANHEGVHDLIFSTIREMFATAVVVSTEDEASALTHAASNSGSTTTVASTNSSGLSAQRAKETSMDLSDKDDKLLDEELREYSSAASSLPALMSTTGRVETPRPCPPLSSHLVGLALILPDLLKVVEKLINTASSTSNAATPAQVAREQRYGELGCLIWERFCARLQEASSAKDLDSGTDKMRQRLLRFALNFALGPSTSHTAVSGCLDSQVSTLIPSLQTDSVLTAADLINGSSSRDVDHGSRAFQWQLRLLHQVIGLAASAEELGSLLQHPKSKTSAQLLMRVDRMVDDRDQLKTWLAQWDKAAAATSGGDDTRIDFSAKPATSLCVLLYLLLKLAAAFDKGGSQDSAANDESSSETLWEMVGLYEQIVDAVAKSVDRAMESNVTAVKFRQFVSKSARAAKALLERDQIAEATCSDRAIGGRLLTTCARLSSRSEESQTNAEALLQLKRSPVKDTLRDTTARTGSVTIPIVATGTSGEEEPQSVVSITSDGVTSPCLLQAQRAVPAAPQPQTNHEDSSANLSPQRRPRTTTAADPTTPFAAPHTPPRPRKSAIKPFSSSTPSRPSVSTPSRSLAPPPPTDMSPSAIIFPELVGATEPFAQLLNKFSIVFRTFSTFYKIETVGQLAAMTVGQVQNFGIKDIVGTVRKVLNDFRARRSRPWVSPAINSPFRLPSSARSTPAKSPAGLPSPSPKRILKRPTTASLPNRLPVTPLPFDSPQQRKRARRSLQEFSDDADDTATPVSSSAGLRESGGTPASEQRVKFKLETEDGATRITHPGADSQEGAAIVAEAGAEDETEVEKPKETPQEKMETHAKKFQHHLRRSLYHIDKIVMKEESLQSDASLGETTSELEFMVHEINAARDLVLRINSQLLQAAQKSRERGERIRAGDS